MRILRCFIVLLLFLVSVVATAAETNVFNRNGVNVYDLGVFSLMTIKLSDMSTAWYVIDSEKGNTLLGDDISSFNDVYQMAASKNGRYLAVVSVAEGHPVLEIFDFIALADKKKETRLAVVNPYPGGVWIKEWEKDRLYFESDVHISEDDVRGRNIKKPVLEKTGVYYIEMPSKKVVKTSKTGKN